MIWHALLLILIIEIGAHVSKQLTNSTVDKYVTGFVKIELWNNVTTEQFNNQSFLSQSPDIVGENSGFNFHLRPEGIHGLYPNAFAARLSGFMAVDAAGQYKLHGKTQNSFVLYIGGKQCIDTRSNGPHSSFFFEGKRPYEVTGLFHKRSNPASLALYWKREDSPLPSRPIPSTIFYRIDDGHFYSQVLLESRTEVHQRKDEL